MARDLYPPEDNDKQLKVQAAIVDKVDVYRTSCRGRIQQLGFFSCGGCFDVRRRSVFSEHLSIDTTSRM